MNTTGKQWFVILNQWEVERCSSSAQILVFMAVKSFCGNGKLKRGISIREITTRSKYSTGWVRKVIDELREKDLVFTHGKETRRGGSVEVFSVGTDAINHSVPPVIRSVPQLGTKSQQSNKVNKRRELDKTFSLNRKGEAQDSGAGAGDKAKFSFEELENLLDKVKTGNGGRSA